MNFKKYFDVDLKTTTFFTILGVIMGYISFVIRNNITILLVMVAIAIIGKFAAQHLIKEKKDYKWWIGNGIGIYVFVWFIVWTIFYNVLV